MTEPTPGRAWFRGLVAEDPVECVDLRTDPDALDAGGFWAVVGEFEGGIRAWRFRTVRRVDDPTAPDAGGATARPWSGPRREAWTSSLDGPAYRARVEAVRAAIREGDVYQVNVCRVLAAPLAGSSTVCAAEPDATALARAVVRGNPAPYGGGVHVPASSGLPAVWVVTASPELFLRVHDGVVASGPIKGTAPTPDGLTAKDRAENVMIADMVRNDLQRVCLPGTVEVTSLLAVEHHPGLVHLVTTVQGELTGGRVRWAPLLEATYPPASVSGAPRSSALRLIGELEPVPRGPYCGAVGWVDADAGRAELAVGIRTFWWTRQGDGRTTGSARAGGAGATAADGVLRFGTGAGITWESDPWYEWEETELKARRLLALASGEDDRTGTGTSPAAVGR